MTAFASDKYNSLNPIAASRVRNALMTGLNAATYIPKLIVVILEDDILNAIHISKNDEDIKNKIITEMSKETIKWLMREFWRCTMSLNEFLPDKSRQVGWPHFLWVLPTQHKNYSNNYWRGIFADCISTEAVKYGNVSALDLKQVWDFEDGSIYPCHSKRFSYKGYDIFWQAVDRTVRYGEMILDKRMQGKTKMPKRQPPTDNSSSTETKTKAKIVSKNATPKRGTRKFWLKENLSDEPSEAGRKLPTPPCYDV